MKVHIIVGGIFALSLAVCSVTPRLAFGLIFLGGFILFVSAAAQKYLHEKKKWLEEEEASRAENTPAPPPADTSPATPHHGIGIGEEVPAQAAWTRTPEDEANTDAVKYCTPVAFQAPGRASDLELEITKQ